MKKLTIVLEINGVRHKLIKTKVENPCKKCSLKDVCINRVYGKSIFCAFDSIDTRYRKCKKGE